MRCPLDNSMEPCLMFPWFQTYSTPFTSCTEDWAHSAGRWYARSPWPACKRVWPSWWMSALVEAHMDPGLGCFHLSLFIAALQEQLLPGETGSGRRTKRLWPKLAFRDSPDSFCPLPLKTHWWSCPPYFTPILGPPHLDSHHIYPLSPGSLNLAADFMYSRNVVFACLRKKRMWVCKGLSVHMGTGLCGNRDIFQIMLTSHFFRIYNKDNGVESGFFLSSFIFLRKRHRAKLNVDNVQEDILIHFR